MLSIKDLLSILDRWPFWTRIKQAPARLDELETRIARLDEAAGSGQCAKCPGCGKSTLFVTATERTKGPFADLGVVDRTYTCHGCGFAELRQEKPG